LYLPERDTLLSDVRGLTDAYKAGGLPAAHAFRQLADLLLRVTILAPEGAVRSTSGPRGSAEFALGGWGGPEDPLPLTDGRYLRLTVRLYIAPPAEGSGLKVAFSSYQYQLNREGDRWVFRYDYLRTPPNPYPAAHVQVRGSLVEDCLPHGLTLERIHFPTARVSLEAVIRLLADQFETPYQKPPEVWRPILAETERSFLEIAHHPLAGPER
jgi:hypothetical protein